MFCTPIVLCLLNCITGQGHMWPLVIPALDDRKKNRRIVFPIMSYTIVKTL